jgi:hypothetical protein
MANWESLQQRFCYGDLIDFCRFDATRIADELYERAINHNAGHDYRSISRPLLATGLLNEDQCAASGASATLFWLTNRTERKKQSAASFGTLLRADRRRSHSFE